MEAMRAEPRPHFAQFANDVFVWEDFPIGEIKEAAGPRVFYYPSPTDLSTGQELVMCSYPYPFDKAAVCTESALVAPTVLYR